MEKSSTIEDPAGANPHKNKVHKVLAHSYLFYFISFLLAISLDFVFPIKIFKSSLTSPLGAFFLILGTLLILWAQMSSVKLQKENISKEVFYHGPYRYTRSPTHFGLLFLMLGFGIMNNALFMIILSILSFIVTKLIFLKEEEKILAEKYGIPYLEYKKSVKF
jgi:protein-S-isoprenylcysteine O-methyltransferase Ste14